jgi:hypothetical protein
MRKKIKMQNYQYLNAFVCEKIEKELKKMDIYEDIFNEWSDIYFEFMKKIDYRFTDRKCYYNIYSNQNIKLDIIEREIKEEKRNISLNPNMTIEFVKKYSNLDWDFMSLCSTSEKITFQEMKDIYEDGEKYNFYDFQEKRKNIIFEFLNNLTLKDVFYNLDMDYQWQKDLLLMESRSITLEEYKKYENYLFFTQNYDNEFDYGNDNTIFLMNFNKTITKKDILNNPNYEWKKDVILRNNKNLEFEDLLELGFIDLSNKAEILKYIQNVKLTYLKKYPQIDWFSSNNINYSSNITIEEIKNNSEYKWDYTEIFGNPNLTFDYVIKNIENTSKNNDIFFISEILSSNPFTFQRVDWILKRITNYYIQNKLYEELIIKTWHPKRVENWCFTEDEKI